MNRNQWSFNIHQYSAIANEFHLSLSLSLSLSSLSLSFTHEFLEVVGSFLAWTIVADQWWNTGDQTIHCHGNSSGIPKPRNARLQQYIKVSYLCCWCGCVPKFHSHDLQIHVRLISRSSPKTNWLLSNRDRDNIRSHLECICLLLPGALFLIVGHSNCNQP